MKVFADAFPQSDYASYKKRLASLGIPHHSKNYAMMISIAEQLGLPDRLIKANISNTKKVEAILNYLDLPQHSAEKQAFGTSFSYYLRNMYYVMMTRGRKGCLVYFKNQI